MPDLALEDLVIKTDRTLSYSPAFKIIMAAWVDLLLKDMVEPVVLFNNTNQVTYAMTTEGDVVGAISYNIDISNKQEAFITMSTVAPKYRRLGVSQLLYKEVVDECRRRGAKSMYSFIHVKNEPMLALLKKQSREITMVKTRLDL